MNILQQSSTSNLFQSTNLILLGFSHQGLLSMERNHVIIRFLPILFNQLFKVLIQNDSDEVTTTTTRYGGLLEKPGLSICELAWGISHRL